MGVPVSSSEESKFHFLGNIPRMCIGKFPSPIKSISLSECSSSWVKDDGSCSTEYGGNKVRKLEFLLAYAKGKGYRKLVVPGDIGSHTILACCLHGIKKGFSVTAVVYPHLKNNGQENELDMLRSMGAEVLVRRSLFGVIASSRLLAWRENGYWIPFGGSTPHSALGYLAAAIELSEQIDRGELPLVKKVFVPFGTGGTVAGLLVGFALLDLPIKIVAVQSVEAVFANLRSLKKQVRNLLELIGRADLMTKAMDGLSRVEDGYLGKGYRASTDLADNAVKIAEHQGIRLETAFSGKTMAALIDEVRIDDPAEVLFWNTHDQSGVFC